MQMYVAEIFPDFVTQHYKIELRTLTTTRWVTLHWLVAFKKNSSPDVKIWSQETWDEPYMREKMQMQRRVQSVNLKGRGYLECLGVDWRITLKWILNILRARIGFVWLMVRTGGRRFRRQWTAGCIRGEELRDQQNDCRSCSFSWRTSPYICLSVRTYSIWAM